jgi:hypothetical protein
MPRLSPPLAGGDSYRTGKVLLMSGKIEVGFHCKACGLRSSVEVTARLPDEDVVDWVQGTAQVIQFSHSMASPECRQNKVDIAIPIGDLDAPIGSDVPKQHQPYSFPDEPEA